MMRYPYGPPLRPWSRAAGLLLAAGLTSASCSFEASFRRGERGDSCTRTDDCVAPLRCIRGVCGGPGPATGGFGGTGGAGGDGLVAGTGGSGATGGTATTGGFGGSSTGGSGGSATGGGATGGSAATGGFGGTGGASGQAGAAAGPGVGPGLSLGACDDCLDTQCSDEIWACTSACIGVEACIETVCRAIPDSGEEGQCQVYCQNSHPGGKQPHLAVVNCAYSGVCYPPCGIYPQDYDACRLTMTNGDCADEWSACTTSVDCLLYRDCTSTCTTFAGCLACSGSPDGMAGRLLLEAYETCIATECIAESWAW